MDSALLRVARRLLDERRPYALATVVHRERPSSAAPGNTALITGGGRVHGWIGGSCTQPEVVRHALAALAEGRPRLLGFGALPDGNRDIVPVPMSCGSEGKVEVHVNPVFPVPRLVVAGSSPIADAVARLGAAMRYEIEQVGVEGEGDAGRAQDSRVESLEARASRWTDRPPGDRLFAVVATMGRGDEDAVRQILAARPDYVGVVVSPKRMRQVRAVLEDLGAGADEVARVHGPAGLDIGAESPEEVAVSILAEIVAVGAGKGAAKGEGAGAAGSEPGAEEGADRAADTCCAGEEAEAAAAHPAGAPATAMDPVCGMTVAVEGSPSFTYKDQTLHFCCPGCRARFEADPAAYV
ncbi:MAG: XdhC family protein [Gemmatimonadota bacterium]|nr:XdhC family protein [Gemmatimonadota bacterium]